MDIPLLFSTRIIRLFCYGFLSVILALYLVAAGFTETQIGLLFTFTLVGDAVISLWLTTSADRFGRKRTLLVGALLMAGAGIGFVLTRSFFLLALTAIIGVISPADKDIGPFLSVEQASLTKLIPDEKRTHTFAWYNLAGSFAAATGALTGGWLAQSLQRSGWTALDSYRIVLAGYALGGFILFLLFLNLSSSIEVQAQSDSAKRVFGLHRSRNVVFKLSSLFALDAFAGGLIVQSMFAYWFFVRFGVDAGTLGSIFFGANILAGISALLAIRLANTFGLINTMVFTHIPSNVLLILIPLMPTLAEDFFTNPIGNLGTIKCFPWNVGGKSLLIGDAAHAVVPFYGQGMNASFEDCRILNQLIEKRGTDWETIFDEFTLSRKPNADAIAGMAEENFYEMRDAVADAVFQRKRELETRLEQTFPDYFSKYSMVTFREDLPYSVAMEKGNAQDRLLMEICAKSNDIETIDMDGVLHRLRTEIPVTK